MMKITRIIVLSLVSLLLAAQVQAAEISFVGSATLPNLSITDLPSGTTATTATHAGFGGGVLLNFHLTPMVSFEVGGLYTDKKFDITASAGGVSATSTFTGYYLQIPALLRYWVNPMFSLGVGGFWEHGETGSYTSGTVSDDGVVGSVGIRLPLGSGGTKFLVDGRYYYGLTNIGSNGDTAHYRDIQVLAGFSFPLGMGR